MQHNMTLFLIFINRSLGISCVNCIDWSIETATEEKRYSQHPLFNCSLYLLTNCQRDIWGEGKGVYVDFATIDFAPIDFATSGGDFATFF